VIVDLIEESRITHGEIEATINAISIIELPSTTRNVIASSLLQASLDHARAVAFLLEFSGAEFGASTIVLTRSCLDQFLRGAFFSLCASDEEVEFFSNHDEMPSCPGENGKNQKLGPRLLAPLVSEAMRLSSKERLINLVSNNWGLMSAFTHGGTSLVSIYSSSPEIGSSLTNDQLVPIVRGLGTLTTLAACVHIQASGLNLNEQQPILEILNEIAEKRKTRTPDVITTSVKTDRD